MTQEDAMGILESQGFEFEDHDVEKWSGIFLFDERVGTLYDDEVYLAESIPSLFDGTYRTTSKSCVKFNGRQGKEEKLQSAIDKLKNSLSAYDGEKRKQRVSLVKQYFQKRDEANGNWVKMEKLP